VVSVSIEKMGKYRGCAGGAWVLKAGPRAGQKCEHAPKRGRPSGGHEKNAFRFGVGKMTRVGKAQLGNLTTKVLH